MQINNKTILITGAARGIGKETAIALARAGADIFGVDLYEKGLLETEKAVKSLGKQFDYLVCDIRDAAAAKQAIDQTAGLRNGFDILINNAGVAPSGAFVAGDFTTWRKTVEVNLLSLMHLTYLALPHLLARKSAHIVNIASIAGKFGVSGLAAYSASKHGVVGFSAALRAELADQNIGVSWICPTFVNTRMAAGVKRTFVTPIVEPEIVAVAIFKAIRNNASEVFVPRMMRFSIDLFPTLFPKVSRKIAEWTHASHGWLVAEKKLPV